MTKPRNNNDTGIHPALPLTTFLVAVSLCAAPVYLAFAAAQKSPERDYVVDPYTYLRSQLNEDVQKGYMEHLGREVPPALGDALDSIRLHRSAGAPGDSESEAVAAPAGGADAAAATAPVLMETAVSPGTPDGEHGGSRGPLPNGT